MTVGKIVHNIKKIQDGDISRHQITILRQTSNGTILSGYKNRKLETAQQDFQISIEEPRLTSDVKLLASLLRRKPETHFRRVPIKLRYPLYSTGHTKPRRTLQNVHDASHPTKGKPPHGTIMNGGRYTFNRQKAPFFEPSRREPLVHVTTKSYNGRVGTQTNERNHTKQGNVILFDTYRPLVHFRKFSLPFDQVPSPRKGAR